jgi:hypothetical protein
MSNKFNIEQINLITGQAHYYEIDGLNYWAKETLGGVGGHDTAIDALNEICVQAGGTGGHRTKIDALNAIALLYNCSGGWANEYEALYEIVQQGSLLNYDVNAKAFLDAASITDATQSAAVNTFVKELKAINEVQPNFVNFDTPADSICVAIYPFVGGTAETHKFNLINPVNSDAAHRLTYAGTVTHDEKGIKGNGSDSNVNLHLSSSFVGETSHGIDIFKNGPAENAGNNWILINGGSPYIFIKNQASNSNDIILIGARTQKYSTSGLVNLNRRSQIAADFEDYESGVKFVSAANATTTRKASNFTLLSYNGSYVSTSIVSYVSVRSIGVSEVVMNLYISAILNLHNNLGRMPKKNIVFEGHSFLHNQPGSTYTDWLLEQTVIKLNATYENRIYRYIGSAVSGSVIAALVSRKSTAVDPYYMSNLGMKNIMPLWIGTNDITNTAGCGATAYAAFKSLYNSYVASGWTVIPFTITQKYAGVGQQEAERVIFNNLVRTDLAPQHLIDCETIPELVDSNNTTYFQIDKRHLTAVANQICSTALAAKIATIV